MENFKIPQVNFKIREGDVVLEDGCSFDEGKWIEKTTDDFFKGIYGKGNTRTQKSENY